MKIMRSVETVELSPDHGKQGPHRPISNLHQGRPVDLVHLAKYTLGDRSLECDLLGLFRRQAGVYLGELERTGSAAEWADKAHGLKGSALGIGAWHLAETAAEAEALGSADPAARDEMLRRLRDCIMTVDLFIDSILCD